MQTKLLITAGCSFSQAPAYKLTWPVHLAEHLKNSTKSVHLGHGAAGNGIISRKVIYQVNQNLQKYKNDEILVGIMWSGPDRFECFSQKYITHRHFHSGFKNSIFSKNEHYSINTSGANNPLQIAVDATDYGWYLMNSHWDDHTTSTFFKHFYDEVYATILTIEHILRIQWFLTVNKINYFMMKYSPNVLNSEFYSHPECMYLYKMIDFSYFTPDNDIQSWIKEQNLQEKYNNYDSHPSTEMHHEYTQNIIIPHLKDKGYISSD